MLALLLFHLVGEEIHRKKPHMYVMVQSKGLSPEMTVDFFSLEKICFIWIKSPDLYLEHFQVKGHLVICFFLY